jgi:ferrous iron transport protein B
VIAARERYMGLSNEQAQEGLRHSVAGRIGTALESVTQWTGFDWRTNVALVSGFAAKEVIVSTMGTAYSLGMEKEIADIPLSERLSLDPTWNPLKAFSLIVFIMLYAPCLATVTCIIRESGAWKWGLFSMVFNTTAAFIIAVVIYQAGLWLGLGR